MLHPLGTEGEFLVPLRHCSDLCGAHSMLSFKACELTILFSPCPSSNGYYFYHISGHMSVVSSEPFWNMTGILRERTEGSREREKRKDGREGEREKEEEIWGGTKEGGETEVLCVFLLHNSPNPDESMLMFSHFISV